jgi:hypothetical protein
MSKTSFHLIRPKADLSACEMLRGCRHLITLGERRRLLHLLAGRLEGCFGLVKLEPQLDDRALEVVTSPGRRFGIGG